MIKRGIRLLSTEVASQEGWYWGRVYNQKHTREFDGDKHRGPMGAFKFEARRQYVWTKKQIAAVSSIDRKSLQRALMPQWTASKGKVKYLQGC